MTVLPNMGITLPTRGPAGAGLWEDTIDANYALEDAHDHSTGKGVRVPSAGLNINADIPFSSLYAPTQLHRVSFSSIAGGALTGSHNKSLFVSDGTGGLSANELYWRTNAGNNVKVTSGSSLNISLAGAIGGDYSSVGAQLNYDDTGKRYTLSEGTVDSNRWARLACGPLRLFEFNTTDIVYVEQVAPAALASSYTVTWPTAAPGATSLVQMDSGGVLTASNTVANALTFSVAPTFTLGYKHSDEWEVVVGGPAMVASPAGTAISFGGSVWSGFGNPPNDIIYGAVPGPRVGDVITKIIWHFNKASNATVMTMKLQTRNGTTNTDRDTLADVTGGAAQTTVTKSGINYTVVTGDDLRLSVQSGVGVGSPHTFSHAQVFFTHP